MTEAGHAISLERTFATTPDRVFRAFTDPAWLARWLSPGNLVVEEAIADAQVGGRFRVAMRDPEDGSPHVSNGVYREVVPNERIVHTWQWEGSDLETLLVIDIEPLAECRTRLRLTHARFPDEALATLHNGGWNACIAKLEVLEELGGLVI